MYLILLKTFSVFDWLLSFKKSFIPASTRTLSPVNIFKFTSRYCNNCFDVVPGNDRCLAFPFYKALLKSCISVLLSMMSLKINIFSCSGFFCYFVTKRFITWKYWYFRKFHFIFWSGINYDRRPPF